MVSNLERYKKDLEELIYHGKRLLQSVSKDLYRSIINDVNRSPYKDYFPDEFHEEWKKIELEELPDFKMEYQTWYSEALTIIEQMIPGRKCDFIELYEGSKKRESYSERFIKEYLKHFKAHPLKDISAINNFGYSPEDVGKKSPF